MTRRHLLQWAGVSAATLVLPVGCSAGGKGEDGKKGEDKRGDTYPFTLPKLPYAEDALEPHIDAETMKTHHDKHHLAYVNALNAALKDHDDLHKKTLVELIRGLNDVPEKVRMAVRNQGGGHLNHSLFWMMMAKDGGGDPKGELAKAIDTDLGGVDKLKDAALKAALARFGSGWVWLVFNKGKLAVRSSANQDNPLTEGDTPLLGIDVWEHAYYLKYKNLRADYVKAWWNVVNWNDIAERYNAAKKS
ncbi:MAG: superoxide dismutase [Planctomycetes bacterium]|nr:superoxide dismutase [Planctomycetota bacterium]